MVIIKNFIINNEIFSISFYNTCENTIAIEYLKSYLKLILDGGLLIFFIRVTLFIYVYKCKNN